MRQLAFPLMLLGLVICSQDLPAQADRPKKPMLDAKTADDEAFPKARAIEEIAKAADPSATPGNTHVLAWKIIEDNRPFRVEYCLVLCRLKEREKKDVWLLASLARNEASKQWSIASLHWLAADRRGGWIWHYKRFDKRPTNKDIYQFMEEHKWHLGADPGWRLLGGAVCKRTWHAIVNEKPTRDFENRGL